VTVRRRSRIWVGVDVTHDGGEEAADALGVIALAKVEQAMIEEGATIVGGGVGVDDKRVATVGAQPDAPPR
jgi:hypothetical protein